MDVVCLTRGWERRRRRRKRKQANPRAPGKIGGSPRVRVGCTGERRGVICRGDVKVCGV